MQRFYQVLYALALLVGSWYGMMAIHELGHVVGAVITGGSVTQVVLHPLSISRTDVAPNPQPAVVVWAGPILGVMLPWLLYAVVPRRLPVARKTAGFFAGFCLLANGAYIGGGAWDGVGDCREMLQTGTPVWVMIGFGMIAVSCGLLLWHRLGSLRDFERNSQWVTAPWALGLALVVIAFLCVTSVLFPAK